MLVYRAISEKELEYYLKGKIVSKKYSSGRNTHNYDPNIRYIHFFDMAEAAQKFKQEELDGRGYKTYIIQCDFDKEVLNKYKGYGYYYLYTEWQDPYQMIGFVPLLEYAIPISEFSLKNFYDLSVNVPKEWLNYDKFVSYIHSTDVCCQVKQFVIEHYNYSSRLLDQDENVNKFKKLVKNNKIID